MTPRPASAAATDLFAPAPAAPGLLAPSPVPARLQPPRWKDGRLVAGVLLVLLSVLLGGALLNRGASTTSVLALRADVSAGHVLVADDLTVVKVHFTDGTAAGYLTDASSATGHRMTRAGAAGELLATAAVGTTAAGPQRQLAIAVTGPRARLAIGDRVDVYVSRSVNGVAVDATCPVQLAAVDVEVAAVPGADTPVGSEGSVLVVLDPVLVGPLVARTTGGTVTLVRHVPDGDAPTPAAVSCGQTPIDGQATVAPAAGTPPTTTTPGGAAQPSADPLTTLYGTPVPAATP